MAILIKKKGVLDTIQDLGRIGFRKSGINPNGAMDQIAVRLINTLLGNPENQAAIEMHFPAPQIEFHKDIFFALGGANFGAMLNNNPLNNWQIHHAEKGAVLKFTNKIQGNRCYLVVKKGFKLEKWLDSTSTNLKAEIGGFKGRSLQKGDRLEFDAQETIKQPIAHLTIGRSILPFYSRIPTIRITVGAEYSSLTALSELSFLRQPFKITQNSDRMGFRLNGPALHLLHKNEMVSSAVNFGTIQLLPDGQIIVLMADHQTSGGYPKIGHIIKQDLPLIAQLASGDEVNFQIISLEEAENIRLRFEKDISFLRFGLSR